jgi:hypothetical protein
MNKRVEKPKFMEERKGESLSTMGYFLFNL